jgi:hypothetical protein
MDGVDLARELKMRWPHLAVVLTSGNPGTRLVHLPPGVEYMPKPWQPSNLRIVAERARSAVRPNVLNLADFQRRRVKAPVTKARDPRIVYLRTEDQKHDRPSKLFDYFAAASIVMSATFRPSCDVAACKMKDWQVGTRPRAMTPIAAGT